MGFSNISKHKYSWALNIIRCVYWVYRVGFELSKIMIIKLDKILSFLDFFVMVYIMTQFR